MGTLIVNQYLNFDVDATAYIAAVESADGQTLENTTRMAFDRFIKGCKADGIWDDIGTACILSGARTLTGALTPLKGTAPTNYNFVSGDYNRKTGLLGDKTNKYLDSNVFPNTIFTQNDVHISAFVSVESPSVSTVQTVWGNTTFSTQSISLAYVSGFLTVPRLYSKSGTSNVTGNTGFGSTPLDFCGVSRNNSANFICRNRNSEQIFTADSTTVVNNSVEFFAREGTSHFGGAISFYSLGTAINLLVLEQRVSQLMTDINNAF